MRRLTSGAGSSLGGRSGGTSTTMGVARRRTAGVPSLLLLSLLLVLGQGPVPPLLRTATNAAHRGGHVFCAALSAGFDGKQPMVIAQHNSNWAGFSSPKVSERARLAPKSLRRRRLWACLLYSGFTVRSTWGTLRSRTIPRAPGLSFASFGDFSEPI